MAFKETDGDHFETMRSLNQELTFFSAENEFSKRKVEFGTTQMRTLNMIDADGLYTNLGLLLSDQCEHTIKAAVFQGTDPFIFKDRKEFSGSLFQQMNDIYDYIEFRNQIRSTIEGLIRVDVRDYPEVAVREALFNLIVHRDYSFSASSFVRMYVDRIEFVSIGGLLSGISLEEIMMGISVCRNQNLANVFYRLELIEAYGTGMQKIMDAYKDTNVKPSIQVTPNAFKIVLPNVNARYEIKKDSMLVKEEVSTYSTNSTLSVEENQILEYAQFNPVFKKRDVMALLDVSSATASRIIKRMLENNLLIKSGNARSSKYRVRM